MKDTKKGGERRNEVPEVQEDKAERREDGIRGEMGEERQVMLGPRHTRSEGGKKRERDGRKRRVRRSADARFTHPTSRTHTRVRARAPHDTRGAHTI